MMEERPLRLKFGCFVVDVKTGELLRDGNPVSIQQKPFDLLVALLERPGELVPRDDLYKRLWPGVVADYRRGLDTAVKKLRRALEDEEAAPRYIETLPRRGYRFIAPVRPASGECASYRLSSFGYARPPVELQADSEANRLYLQGCHCWNKRTPDSLNAALGFFREARNLEPRRSQFHAAIALVYVSMIRQGILRPAEAVAEARAAASEALLLDGSDVIASLVLAWARGACDYDLAGSVEQLRAIAAAEPGHPWPPTFVSLMLAAAGDREGAIEAIEKAHQLDPVSPAIYAFRGLIRFFGRDFEEAARLGALAVQRDPEFGLAHFYYGQELIAINDTAGAIRHLEIAADRMGESSEVRAVLGIAYARAGKRARALEIDRELESASQSRYVDAYHRALLHLALGNRESALQLLDRAREDRSSWFAFAAVDPQLDALRPETASLG